ncbi:MAG: DUF917 domain-containing protein [Tepidanaerobacteraceae bacterium]|jgi:DUF917 family protein|nr:DUF917 domain-containing protein [Tepidanaerobacteraceae bacterium]
MNMSVYDIIKRWGIKNYRVVDEQGLKEITLGASILATGGGGDPEIGFLWALNVVKERKDIVLIDPRDFPDDALAAIAGCLGAPVVLTEKPPNGKEVLWCLESLKRYLGKEIQAIIPPEAGGVNTPVPMAVAGAVGIPVVDADGMGRAFPELQMTSFYTHGIMPSPTAAANEKGAVTVADAASAIMAERIIRNAAMAYGGISWIAGYPMTGRQLKEAAIFNSISKSWELGKAVYKCRKTHDDPIENIVKIVGGYKVFKGKIVDINREFGAEKTKGFSMGRLTLEGLEEYRGEKAFVDFQNEWLRLEISGKVKCLAPDLILILDSETGEPIRTDIVKYGYRGSIVVVPADEKMRTDLGIETFGPKYFGYDEDYTPVEKLV